MDDFRDLYQELILDHNKNPRNFRKLDDATHQAEGFNALCGDRYTIYLKVDDGIIKDVSFHGSGCAISKASASVMTLMIKGKTIQEAEKLFDKFHNVMMGKPIPDDSEDVLLGKLEAFTGVTEFPMRVKCATLSWHAMSAALHEKEIVSSEHD